MKKLLSLFLILISSFSMSHAQDDSDFGNLFISVVRPDLSSIPDEAGKQLELKLNQLLMNNGVASTDPYNRFVITTKVSVLTKDIVPGPPAKVSMHIDFTFIVGDVEDNKIFESATVSAIGVGINENKAFIAAIKTIKPRMPLLTKMLENAKAKIVEYYKVACPQMISDAKMKAAVRNYEEAMAILVKIPKMCDCAEESQKLLIKYNKEYFDNYAKQMLNKARAIWSSSPNQEGASDVAEIISQIPANASCQPEINRLTNQINSKLQADQRKVWEFKMKQYNDRIEAQRLRAKSRLEQQRSDNAFRSELLSSATRVAVSFLQGRARPLGYASNIGGWLK